MTARTGWCSTFYRRPKTITFFLSSRYLPSAYRTPSHFRLPLHIDLAHTITPSAALFLQYRQRKSNCSIHKITANCSCFFDSRRTSNSTSLFPSSHSIPLSLSPSPCTLLSQQHKTLLESSLQHLRQLPFSL